MYINDKTRIKEVSMDLDITYHGTFRRFSDKKPSIIIIEESELDTEQYLMKKRKRCCFLPWFRKKSDEYHSL